ncbi:putative fatty acid elongation protein 4 [Centruroides sculpturatus]|uniref:putative fatty acid elongation protein 4 n=1 Tax=Centruroides sculpturatus TaxID=218467 RepID=UPI000C6DD1ED|nr:putative fatty acid elongation protein 4 [Centruroides sculpturatus]
MKTHNVTIAVEPFYFERTFFNPDFVRYFFGNYWHYSIYISIIYLMTIKILQHHMNDRPPYNFKRAFTIWNGLLAIYSICTIIRGIPVLYEAFKQLTFYEIICDKNLTENTPAILFWTVIFVFSKVWELGDTIFIILNKRNLMFLHCYHHVMTVILTWYAVFRESSYLTTVIYVNTFVHSLMYSYFTLKCMEIKIFPIVAMLITVIQITQMVYAFLLTSWIYWLLINGHPCDTPLDVLKFCFLLFMSYLYLFTDLFHKSYIRKLRRNKKEN